MALSDSYPEVAVFVCKKDEDDVMEPRGTAFFISIEGRSGASSWYLVTAGHIVKDKMPTWVRLPRDEGTPHDQPVSDWTEHASADVAITPCVIDLGSFVLRSVPENQFADKWEDRFDSKLVLTDAVYFIGLLDHVETMRDRAIPMLRGGLWGAKYQENIPLRDETSGEMTVEPVAHLIDCHSVGGFSGSPVFIGQSGITQGPSGDLAIGGAVMLLGVLVGHFAGPRAGIGVVVPVEAIRELLAEPKFVKERKRSDDNRRC